MADFWETNFKNKKKMWGDEPAKAALITKSFFVEKGINNVLIPGIGYGRNAKVFWENGMTVTGIEISKTAIELAKEYYVDAAINMYHGSVSNMPFDNKKYEGVFCYALIHLLNKRERMKFILDCYNQLAVGGYMVFTAITQDAANYGKGNFISKNRYEFHKGAKIFYYDRDTVKAEFNKVGLIEIIEVNENQPMFLIKCKKE